MAYVATLLPVLPLRLPVALLPGAIAGLAVALVMRRRLDQAIAKGEGKPGMKRILRQPLLFAAVMMGFAHGAGDAGNVAGPLLVILTPAQAGALQVPLFMLALAGGIIALGAFLFGRRLVGMVSEGITRLNAVRAFCITLATAMIVLAASRVAGRAAAYLFGLEDTAPALIQIAVPEARRVRDQPGFRFTRHRPGVLAQPLPRSMPVLRIEDMGRAPAF